MNANVQQLSKLLKSQPLMGGSDLRPVGFLYHDIRGEEGKKDRRLERGTTPEKKSSARVGAILFSFQETVLWVLSCVEKKICVLEGRGNRWEMRMKKRRRPILPPYNYFPCAGRPRYLCCYFVL